MNRRVRRKIKLAGYLAAGAFVLQLGQACTIFNSVATAGIGSSGFLIDDNGFFFGVFNVCGQENIQTVDVNGVQVGDILNTQDDLMFGCPARQIVVANGGGDPDP
jgi:hypothetical protein